jgi:hypothetical protein
MRNKVSDPYKKQVKSVSIHDLYSKANENTSSLKLLGISFIYGLLQIVSLRMSHGTGKAALLKATCAHQIPREGGKDLRHEYIASMNFTD